MASELVVLLGRDVAARLIRLNQGGLRLVYDAGYVGSRGATPLSLSMPLEVAEHADRVVSAWLWNLLPDNDAVLARWSRTFHVSPRSPFSLLATPVGMDCAGAVRFVTADHLDAALSGEGTVTWLTEADVAQRLRDLRTDATAWLGASSTGRFSLAGAQAKTALLYQDGRWGVPSGIAPTTHILKPGISGLDGHELNEHLCLRSARLLGLPAASSTVQRFEGERAIVVERYDRVSGGGGLRRVHQEDLCQALGVPPTRKYQAEGGPTSTQIAGLLRRAMPPAAAATAVVRLLDALIFNWVIGGTDAHAKNYSLLLAGRRLQLAPLYDLASALPYPGMPIQKLRLAMKFGGSYSLRTRDATVWPAVAAELDLALDRVIERARALVARIPDAFASVAAEPGVLDLASPLPGLLVDAVAERASGCAACLP